MLPENNIKLNLKKLRSREALEKELTKLGLSKQGTVPVLKARLQTYIAKKEREYHSTRLSKTTVNFSDAGKSYNFESLTLIDQDFLYGGCSSEKAVMSVELKRDEIGLKGIVDSLCSHKDYWGAVKSLCVSNGEMYVAHLTGID